MARTRVLNAVYTISGSGLMCTWPGNWAASAAMPGSVSSVQSACPVSIWVISRVSEVPKVHTMRSGDPSGWAAADHSRKYGLRAKTTWRPGTYRVITYGPVPGTGSRPMSRAGM